MTIIRLARHINVAVAVFMLATSGAAFGNWLATDAYFALQVAGIAAACAAFCTLQAMIALWVEELN